MHDWVLANERMAKALAAKGYHHQFVFARNAAHVARCGETRDAFRRTTQLRQAVTDPLLANPMTGADV